MTLVKVLEGVKEDEPDDDDFQFGYEDVLINLQYCSNIHALIMTLYGPEWLRKVYYTYRMPESSLGTTLDLGQEVNCWILEQ